MIELEKPKQKPRYSMNVTQEQQYNYDKAMHDKGLGIVFWFNEYGQKVYTYKRVTYLQPVGEKTYQFIGPDGVLQNNVIPTYSDGF